MGSIGMRIVFISCETPQITTILDLLSRHLSENVALARLDVGAGSDIRAVAQEVSDLASSNSNVFVTVTDASLSSLVARVFAKHIGHIHWHLDYFVPIENSCSEITNLPSISGSQFCDKSLLK